jgi:hypothetical protein
VLDGRSDLYSLAATMFAMLTGCALFEGKTAIELLTQHARTPPPHLEQLVPELAQYPKLDELLQLCLAKSRDQRPRTAGDMDQLIAELEIYVSRGGAAARSNKNLKTLMGGSSFFSALPAETLLPAQAQQAAAQAVAAAASPSRANAPTIDPLDTGVQPIVSSRRGLYLALGAAAVVGLIAVTIVVAMKKQSGTKPAPIDAAVVAMPASDAGVLDAQVDAPAVAVRIDAGAAPPPRPDAGVAVVKVPTPPKTNEHLKNAEDAMKQGNRLRQLAEADLALKADPRSVRAKYLLGDALIKGGDLDRGCAYLRQLGRNSLAVARAGVAKCPP